jgi:60 kDa SS-A/Ro ribonucleoprotein
MLNQRGVMKTNTVSASLVNRTYEGAPARRISPEQALRRAVMSCMLWEDEFYEQGVSIAQRISDLIPIVDPRAVMQIAISARTEQHLRHVPLLIVSEMCRHKTHRPFVRETVNAVIQRADELTEIYAIYWKGIKRSERPLAKSLQRGVADAWPRFNAYSLAKYNREGRFSLKDSLFLSHPKPSSPEQDLIWKQLIDGKLESPDTWEVALSAGKDKQATWIRLIEEDKLGGLAILRNLRNMQAASVPTELIAKAINQMKTDNILPFRFLAAARFAPRFISELDAAMMRNMADSSKIPGTTVLLVDVSGSMDRVISDKSDLHRIDAACGLAVIAREKCERAIIFSFSSKVVEIPSFRGIALAEAIKKSQVHSSTYLGRAINGLKESSLTHDRLIVITDEQSDDAVPNPPSAGYLINVASAKNGVGYGPWFHIDGWSDRVVDYIMEVDECEKAK